MGCPACELARQSAGQEPGDILAVGMAVGVLNVSHEYAEVLDHLLCEPHQARFRNSLTQLIKLAGLDEHEALLRCRTRPKTQ